MGALSIAQLSLDEYLHNPEFEHCEYWDGQAFEINLGSKQHSRLQARLGTLLSQYLESNPIGYSATELRCHITAGKKHRLRLPDLCVVLNDPSPDSDYLERSPDFVIEIKSPDDTVAMLTVKMNEYLAAGTKLGWLVLPDAQSIVVFQPGKQACKVVEGAILDGGEVLPGFTVKIDQVFPS